MKDKLDWCFKQKEGLEIVDPSDDLMEAYFLKAHNSMEALADVKGNPEWEITTAYYLMYFSVYAVMMKIGVKSGIHSCTAEFMRLFLGRYFSASDIKLLSRARDLRNWIQYNVAKDDDLADIPVVIKEAPAFMLRCRNISRIIDVDETRNSL